MTRKDLNLLEIKVFKKVDSIRREQEEYLKGFENGIALMLDVVRKHLIEEEQKAAEEEKNKPNCRNCKNKKTDFCKTCIASLDRESGEYSTPSNWERIESEAK